MGPNLIALMAMVCVILSDWWSTIDMLLHGMNKCGTITASKALIVFSLMLLLSVMGPD